MDCKAFCIASKFKFSELRTWARDHFHEVRSFRDVLYVQDPQKGEFFCFDYGCIVFWQVDNFQRLSIIKEIKEYSIGNLSSPIDEDFVFRQGEKFIIENEEIIIDKEDWKVKLALSHAFAQSVKLEVFEGIAQSMIEQPSHIIQTLSKKGKIKMSRREASKQIGRLILQRNEMYLYCDALDTPDFLWEYSEFETYYAEAVIYLDLPQRMQVLERRMELVRDTLDILSNQLNHLHDAFLEWIIILLILIEILVTLFTLVF